MAISLRDVAPVAHLPLVLGMLRKLAVARLIDTLIPPHPEPVLSCGRGVAALVLALLDGHHALYKVGQRLDERGMLPLLQPGLTRASIHDPRLGPILEALFAANLHRVFGQVALGALETYAMATPWRHQDTTTISLYGAYEGHAEEDEAPRPAYGYNKDGRADLTQVLLSLGGSRDGGLPLRLGVRDGNTNDCVDVPEAIKECLALGLGSVQGMVADSKAYSQRTLGLCLEQQGGLVPVVPRPGALRQELEAWGQRQLSLPLLVDKPGKRRQDAPRRWYGRSVDRAGEVDYSDGPVALAPVRFVVVYSTQLAQPPAQASSTAQGKEAGELAQHLAAVEARRFACEADAEAAVAEYEGRGQGRRGRRPCRWRSHRVRYAVQSAWRVAKRSRRGRPAQGDAVPQERCYRLVGETAPLAPPVNTYGGVVLATPVSPGTSSDAEIVRAYRDQTTTVEPGFRWIKNPAALSPGWLEKPQRIAALAMLPVVGLLVYALIQRQVRQYLLLHDQRIPGKKGETATPTAAVVLTSFSQVAIVHFQLDDTEVRQVHGWQTYHRISCEALGLDGTWYEGTVKPENSLSSSIPP